MCSGIARAGRLRFRFCFFGETAAEEALAHPVEAPAQVGIVLELARGALGACQVGWGEQHRHGMVQLGLTREAAQIALLGGTESQALQRVSQQVRPI